MLLINLQQSLVLTHYYGGILSLSWYWWTVVHVHQSTGNNL